MFTTVKRRSVAPLSELWRLIKADGSTTPPSDQGMKGKNAFQDLTYSYMQSWLSRAPSTRPRGMTDRTHDFSCWRERWDHHRRSPRYLSKSSGGPPSANQAFSP